MSKTDLALSPRQSVPKKYPRAPGDIPPPHKSAHNDILCPDSKGKQASKTSPAQAFPLPPFCYALPVLLFLAFCIDRTRRGNNRIQSTTTRKAERKNTTTEKQKRKQEKQEKQAKRETKQANKTKSKRKEKQVITDKQDKEKSKRDPRKAYKQTSKRERKSYTIPPYAYIIEMLYIYYNKAIKQNTSKLKE